jgi:hypothetical protein
MSERPEWVKCVVKTPREGARPAVSYCGRTLWRQEWAFEDAEHARLARGHSRMEPCAACLAAIGSLDV